MGMRSQIYVGYGVEKKRIIARYFSWNYAERMISRARWGIEYTSNHMSEEGYLNYDYSEMISKVLDVNFDMHDIQKTTNIIEEYKEFGHGRSFNDYAFNYHSSNGKLLIDICEGGVIKYAFLDNEVNLDNIMDGEAYMCWEKDDKDWRNSIYYFSEGIYYLSEEYIKITEENIKAISEKAILMTKEEVEEFINRDFDYEYEDTAWAS